MIHVKVTAESLILIRSAMFGATFNLVTRVRLPSCQVKVWSSPFPFFVLPGVVVPVSSLSLSKLLLTTVCIRFKSSGES